MPDEGDLRTSVQSVGEATSRIRHPSNRSLPPRKNTRWVKGSRGLNYEKGLKALKLQFLEIRRLGNDFVLTHKILYNQIDLEATQLSKFARRPGPMSTYLGLFYA